MPDGTAVEWNYATVRQVAKILTVDKNGKDATQAGFDPKSIVQWGFEPQRDDLRGMGAYFGAGTLAGGADGKTAQIPEPWKAAWKRLVQRHVDGPRLDDEAPSSAAPISTPRTTRSSRARSP